MKINVSLQSKGNLLPSALNTIQSIPKEYIYNQSIGIKHPIITYNLSTSRITKSFKKLNDLILESNKASENKEEDLITAEIEVMESMMAHIDDCFSILMSLQPTDPIMESDKMMKKQLFPLQWLNELNNPVYEQFEDEIKKYKNSLGEIVNEIKHQTGRLGFISCNNEKSDEVVYGFFRRKHLNEKVSIEPIRGNRIILFHDDLRYHFYHFYFIGNCLSEAIINSVKSFHETKLNITKVNHNDDAIMEVVETISSNPVLFLTVFNMSPSLYSLQFLKKDNDILFKINTSKNHKSITWDQISCAASFSGDGYSRIFEIP